MENQSTPNSIIFFSPGEVLSDKDRDINSDLAEIHKFFKPIDNLFGDYESRKKFGLTQNLYRRLYSLSENRDKKEDNRIKRSDADILESIQPIEWRNYFKKNGKIDPSKSQIKLTNGEYIKILDEETIILTRRDFEEHEGKLLVLYLIYESAIKDLVIDFDFIDPNDLRTQYNSFFHDKIDAIEKEGNKLHQIFVVDPIKINKIRKDSDSTFKKEIDKLGLKNVQEELILYYILKIKERLHFLIAQKNDIEGITDTNELELFPEKVLESIKKENDAINFEELLSLARKFCNRKAKLKSIEKFNFIRIRLGWENNRYVLFLHPYESETNNPSKIPPGS